MRKEAFLHEGRVLRVTPNGILKSETRRVKLTMPDGHVYPREIWNPTLRQKEKKMVITATGFAHLGNLAGFTFLQPGTMIDENGREVGNPIIKRENGLVSYVRIRRVGIGRSAGGDLRALDRILTYDVLAYYYGDLYQGYAGVKGGCRWGEVVNMEFARDIVRQDKTKALAHVGPDIALIYDLKNEDVVKKVRENNQRALFGDRLAVSVCDRNILKSHFGFSNAPDDGHVEITCWPQADLDWESIRNGLSARSGVIDLDGQKVKVEVSEEEVGQEDIEASEESVDTEDGVKRPQAVESERATHVWVASVADLRQRCKELGPEKFQELASGELTRHKLRLGDLAAVTDEKVISDIWEAVKPKPSDSNS